MASFPASIPRSAIWVGVEAIGGSVVSSFGLLVIAGIVGPQSLGLSAIALGIMQCVNFFPDALFHDAIIQRSRLTTHHLGSAFWIVTCGSVGLAGAVAGLAGMAAKLYDQPDLAPLLLALSGTTVFAAVASIQAARMRRAMRFRRLAIYVIASRFLSTVAGVVLALAGQGAWAIVAQFGLATVILAGLLLVMTQWRFVRYFSLRDARDISTYAIVRTVALFVDSSRAPLFFALLGYYIPLAMLGQINLAFRLVESLTKVIATATLRFFLPIFSRLQRDPQALGRSLRRDGGIATAVLLPPYAILGITGDDLIRLAASAQWQGMGALVPWLCISGMAFVLQVPTAAAILAVGRPLMASAVAGSVLTLSLILLVVLAPETQVSAAICWTIPLLAGFAIFPLVTRHVLRIGLWAQLRGLASGLLVTAAVAAATAIAHHLAHGGVGPLAVTVAMETLLGGLAYAACILVVFRHYRSRPAVPARALRTVPAKEML